MSDLGTSEKQKYARFITATKMLTAIANLTRNSLQCDVSLSTLSLFNCRKILNKTQFRLVRLKSIHTQNGLVIFNFSDSIRSQFSMNSIHVLGTHLYYTLKFTFAPKDSEFLMQCPHKKHFFI